MAALAGAVESGAGGRRTQAQGQSGLGRCEPFPRDEQEEFALAGGEGVEDGAQCRAQSAGVDAGIDRVPVQRGLRLVAAGQGGDGGRSARPAPPMGTDNVAGDAVEPRQDGTAGVWEHP